MDKDRKRKKKAYYVHSKKTKKEFCLDAGMKGFFITCNNKEGRAVNEAYNILNEFADNLYGPTSCQESSHAEEDIESAINNHIDAYKKRDVEERRFQNVDTKINNCIFIKTNLKNPNELSEKIFKEIMEKQLVRSRFILRFLPILGTCSVSEDKLEKLAEEVLDDYLSLNELKPDFKYCIIHKIRCNNKLNKDIILSVINRTVKNRFPQAKVDLNEPDLVLSVNILLKVCCLSILTNFNVYKKYNLSEIISVSSSDKTNLEIDKSTCN